MDSLAAWKTYGPPSSINPVTDLVELGQFANSDWDSDALLKLTIWLATSLRSCRDGDIEMALVHAPPPVLCSFLTERTEYRV
jgi:hypothetical protein